MIISRTPYRISFFGGGTDYHTWYQEHGAQVLTTTINHYCYIQCRTLPAFFKHLSRIVWSRIEDVLNHSQIQHPSVRSVLQYLNIQHGIEIHHQGDLPAQSGLGSSSAFTVGLLHALYALKGVMSSKQELACEAIHIERDILKENVGVQDQIQTAYGGLNHIVIQSNGHFNVKPVILSEQKLLQLNDHLLLFFTGVSRNASDIAGNKIQSIPKKQKELENIYKMVDEGLKILINNQNIIDFGYLLHEAWMVKRQICKSIAPSFIDEIYAKAKTAGAIGGKLLGAGGGGFILFFVQPENKLKVCKALGDLLLVPFNFENHGSQIIFYEPPSYSHMAMKRRDYIHLKNKQSYESRRRLKQINLLPV